MKHFVLLALILMISCTGPAPRNADNTAAAIPPSLHQPVRITAQEAWQDQQEELGSNIEEKQKIEEQIDPQEPEETSLSLTAAEVSRHDTEEDCWAIVRDHVYDLTGWIRLHPGGAQAIRELCGTDATIAFEQQHATQTDPNNQLEAFLLGPLE